MATAISGLGALTIPATDDLVEIVDVSDISMSANGTNKKITFENLLSNWDGWQPANETWTYASASTFTIAGKDVTSRFPVGTRLRFEQTLGTPKYAVVTSSAFSTNTTVTIAVNTDYTIANSTIYNPYYSYASNPVGYPDWFNWTPTVTGAGSMTISSVSVLSASFRVDAKTLNYQYQIQFTIGGSADSYIKVSAPVTAAATKQTNHAEISDDGWIAGFVETSTTLLLNYKSNASNYGLGAGRELRSSGTYRI